MSDHIAGRRLGRPSAHFGWSLTPRDCCWRPLRRWRYETGGTGRRPTRTPVTCATTSSCSVTSRARAAFVDQEQSSSQNDPGGTPRARALFPSVFPLRNDRVDRNRSVLDLPPLNDSLALAADFVVLVSG